MKKTGLLCICLILLLNFCTFAETETSVLPVLHTGAAALMDQNTGFILYGVHADKEIQPAGLTKIVTALAAIEADCLDENAHVTRESLATVTPGSETCGLVADEYVSIIDLVHAILLHNANDAATAIAFHIDSDEESFAERMNAIAVKAGATHTHFQNCRGDEDSEQYTTAEDMARITRYAMQNPVFAEIVAKETYQIAPTNKYDQIRYFSNDNRLLNHYKAQAGEDYYTPNALGVKASHSRSMGYSLSGVLHKSNRQLIVIVAEDESLRALYEDAHTLFNHGLQNYKSITLAEAGDIVDDLPLKFTGGQQHMLLLASAPLKVLLPNDYDEALIFRKDDYKKELRGTVHKGQVVGKVDYYYGEQFLGSFDAVAERDARFNLFAWFGQSISWLFSQWWCKLLLLVILVGLIALFYQWRQKQKRKLRLIKSGKKQNR